MLCVFFLTFFFRFGISLQFVYMRMQKRHGLICLALHTIFHLAGLYKHAAQRNSVRICNYDQLNGDLISMKFDRFEWCRTQVWIASFFFSFMCVNKNLMFFFSFEKNKHIHIVYGIMRVHVANDDIAGRKCNAKYMNDYIRHSILDENCHG